MAAHYRGVSLSRDASGNATSGRCLTRDLVGSFETLFGLIATAGLRISEALTLLHADVDLKFATLTIRRTKFAKSRQLPLHRTTVAALERYRRLRVRHARTTAQTPFFVGSRGRRLGLPLDERQVHRVFNDLVDQSLILE